MHDRRTGSGFGPNPINISAEASFFHNVYGVGMEPWVWHALSDLDRTYLSVTHMEDDSLFPELNNQPQE